MKKFLISLAALLLCLSCLNAQITVMESSIPETGDTLMTKVDRTPQMIDPGAPGGDQLWDFTSLNAPFVQNTVFQPVSEGTVPGEYPSADAVTIPVTGMENYFSITTSQIAEVGVYQKDPIGIGVDVAGKYSNPLPIKQAPLTFGDELQIHTELTFPMSSEQLPDTLVNSIPVEFDSVRLRIEIIREDEVDGWGQLILPDEEAQVLRQKRVEMRDGAVEVKVEFIGWQDISELAGDIIPGGVASEDTIVNYFYFDETSIEPLAMVTVDSTGAASRVEYKAVEPTATTEIATDKPDIGVFPNPSFGEVKFKVQNIPTGAYELEVMNMLGVSLWKNEYYVNGDKVIPVDLTDLSRGTYFYRLVSKNDHTIATKRLVLIRP